jgi:PAS domain-containing protein
LLIFSDSGPIMSCRSLEVFNACVGTSSLSERTELFDRALEPLTPSSEEHSSDPATFDAAVPCIATDGRGVIRAANQPAAPLLGFDAARLPGKPLLHFVPRGATRAFRELVRRLDEIADGPPVAVQLRPRGGKPARLEARVVRLTVDSFEWYLQPAP